MDNQKPIVAIHTHQTIRIYFYYRLILSVLLYLLYVSEFADSAMGKSNPELFEWTSITYIGLCILSFFVFPIRKLARSSKRITMLLLADLFALVVLIHASNGIASGLGYLLLVTAATSSIFVRAQIALAFAALITFFIFGETLSYGLRSSELTKELFSAGILGIFIFLTSITFLYLTNRIRTSTEAAEEQKSYALHLQKLAQHIVERMRTGIAVVDDENTIELINESALQMLNLPTNENYVGLNLSNISTFGKTSDQHSRSNDKIRETKPGLEVRIGTGTLDAGGVKRTILYLEDYRSIIQHAQQLKLASLGRLTASIAHEIRNPLGSISHAAQLLSESPHIHKDDTRFLEIILQNCNRVNQIIENTSVLSRRKEPKPETINLHTWLTKFIDEYVSNNACKIKLFVKNRDAKVKMDASNLRQILINLLDNGRRYSKQVIDEEQLIVEIGHDERDDTSYINVIDFGPGIPKEKQDSVFEPFYTTDKEGSGLGLYICKELCEINQATLSYNFDEDTHSCFKLSFPHNQRMI